MADLTRESVRARDWADAPAGDEIEDALEVDLFGFLLPSFRGKDGKRKRSEQHSRRTESASTMVEMTTATSMTLTWDRSLICEDRAWRCEIFGDGPDKWQSEGEADHPALAICRALLQFRHDD